MTGDGRLSEGATPRPLNWPDGRPPEPSRLLAAVSLLVLLGIVASIGAGLLLDEDYFLGVMVGVFLLMGLGWVSDKVQWDPTRRAIREQLEERGPVSPLLWGDLRRAELAADLVVRQLVPRQPGEYIPDDPFDVVCAYYRMEPFEPLSFAWLDWVSEEDLDYEAITALGEKTLGEVVDFFLAHGARPGATRPAAPE